MRSDPTAVLNLEQLRDMTFNDQLLMREILAMLLEDTVKQMLLLEQAIRERDPKTTRMLAHYAKGACANVGANATAAVFEKIENTAMSQDFDACRSSLENLALEIDRLREKTRSAL